METKLEVKTLEADYYVVNFLKLLNFVAERYDDILSDQEKAFYDKFTSLQNVEQRLFVRLISRKGPYFRLGKLNYPEIDHLNGTAVALAVKGFLFLNPREGLDFALDIWRVDELKDILSCLGHETKGGKSDLLMDIGMFEEDMVWDCIEKLDTMMVPAFFEEIRIFKLLFFGNNYQDLSDFILEDIGVLRYEPYQLEKEDRYFENREKLELTIEKNQLKQELWMALEMRDLEWLDQIQLFMEERKENDHRIRYDKEFNQIGAYHEKNKDFERAYASFALSDAHPANERSIRILDKQGKHHEALDACEELLLQSNNYEELVFAQFYKEEQKRKLGLDYIKRKRLKLPQDLLSLERQEDLSIETQVVAHLNKNDIDAFYTENILWKALFGLAFWDIIFSRQTGVFFNPFQRGPKDLRSSEFRKRRALEIEKRLKEISNGAYQSKMLETFEQKYLTANEFVNWKQIKLQQIETALSTVSNKHLVLILDRMAYKPGEYSSGFPDIYTHTDNSFELIEVKGPGDQLRPNQRAWLQFFEEHQIPFKVLNVQWT